MIVVPAGLSGRIDIDCHGQFHRHSMLGITGQKYHVKRTGESVKEGKCT